MGAMLGRVRAAAVALLLGMTALAAPLGAQASGVVGRVTDGDGRPVPGATVRVLAPDGAGPAATRTENTGGFQLASLAPGSYRLRVERVGYAPHEEPVTLRQGERRTLILRLRADRGRRDARADSQAAPHR